MADYNAYAVACIEALQRWYNTKNGLWNSMGWWNAANAIEALIDHSLLIGTNVSSSVITNTYERNVKSKFFSNYYDDEAWWALAWIKTYGKGRTYFTPLGHTAGGRNSVATNALGS